MQLLTAVLLFAAILFQTTCDDLSMDGIALLDPLMPGATEKSVSGAPLPTAAPGGSLTVGNEHLSFLLPAQFGNEERVRSMELVVVALLLTIALQVLMIYSVAALPAQASQRLVRERVV